MSDTFANAHYHGLIYVRHICFMSGTNDPCLTPMIHVWNQWKRGRKVLLILSLIMSDTSVLCLTPLQMRITTRRLDLWRICIISGTSVLCLTPLQLRITTLRLDLCLAHMHHVWHQWKRCWKVLLILSLIMSGAVFYIWHLCKCALPHGGLIYVWH